MTTSRIRPVLAATALVSLFALNNALGVDDSDETHCLSPSPAPSPTYRSPEHPTHVLAMLSPRTMIASAVLGHLYVYGPDGQKTELPRGVHEPVTSAGRPDQIWAAHRREGQPGVARVALVPEPHLHAEGAVPGEVQSLVADAEGALAVVRDAGVGGQDARWLGVLLDQDARIVYSWLLLEQTQPCLTLHPDRVAFCGRAAVSVYDRHSGCRLS